MLDSAEAVPAVLAGASPLVLPDDPTDLIPTLTAEIAFLPGNPQIIVSAVENWASVEASKLNPSTPKGRAGLVSLSAKVASTKTGLDKLGLALTEGWRARTGAVNADRKRITSALSIVHADVRQPVTDWEAADEARREGHKTAVSNILTLAQFDAAEPSAADIADRLALAEYPGARDWQEFSEQAAQARANAVDRLAAMHAAAVAREAERAELAALRAAAEARRKADEAAAAEVARQEAARRQAERARMDAEAKAEADRMAAERRARAAEVAAARAEAARVAAEERAARARAENARRVGQINRAAAGAIATTAGITQEQAKAVVAVIARGSVPRVSVEY